MPNDTPSQNSNPSNWFSQQTRLHAWMIWGGFLGLIYLLREFFLIGFLTFLMCFAMRGLVGFLKRRIDPNRESRVLELVLTLSIFFAVCLSMFFVGRFFVPQVVVQGRSLVAHIQNTSAEEFQNSLLSNTVGAWQYHRQLGGPQDPRYQKAFLAFQSSGRDGEGLYATFPNLDSSLQAKFEASFERARVFHLQAQADEGNSFGGSFDQWLLQIQVPKIFADRQDYYIARWQADFTSKEKPGELAALRKQPEFERIRERQIGERILSDLKSDPVLLAQFESQWAQAQSTLQWSEFRKSPDYQTQFASFYESQRQEYPASAPFDYDFFKILADAYPKGKQAFLAAVRQHNANSNQSLAIQQHDFEVATKLELGQKWWASNYMADWVRDHAKNEGPQLMQSAGVWFEAAFRQSVRVPVQVFTALVLAIFILMEWQGMKLGVMQIRETRLRPVYDEIVPGIVALGKLLGKSFQAQTVIALFNAAFMLIVMWFIGVEYKFVLAFSVFVFSFIPTVGVLMSSIPIVAIALFQPGGSITMVMQLVAAIAASHLIELMILSPRIIGKIGHLQPVMVIAILLVAEHFFGLWGLMLGVPVAIYLIRIVLLNSPIPGIYEPESTTS